MLTFQSLYNFSVDSPQSGTKFSDSQCSTRAFIQVGDPSYILQKTNPTEHYTGDWLYYNYAFSSLKKAASSSSQPV